MGILFSPHDFQFLQVEYLFKELNIDVIELNVALVELRVQPSVVPFKSRIELSIHYWAPFLTDGVPRANY